jgi:8-oxo-dGTP pyrophosphatase MutT (NUDIX family)
LTVARHGTTCQDGYPHAVFEPLKRRGLRALRVVPAPVREGMVKRTAPRYTLGSVCRLEHDGHVLLVETAYRPGWGFPGGMVDRRERPDVAVLREVREEVGLEVELAGAPIVVVDLRSRTVDFFFRSRLAAGAAPSDARPVSGEITRVHWVPSADVVPIVEASARRTFASKLRLYDEHPDGALVHLEPEPRSRRER